MAKNLETKLPLPDPVMNACKHFKFKFKIKTKTKTL